MHLESANQVSVPHTPFKSGERIIGPCGYGAEVAEDLGGPTVVIEHYNGDRERIRRDLIQYIDNE